MRCRRLRACAYAGARTVRRRWFEPLVITCNYNHHHDGGCAHVSMRRRPRAVAYSNQLVAAGCGAAHFVGLTMEGSRCGRCLQTPRRQLLCQFRGQKRQRRHAPPLRRLQRQGRRCAVPCGAWGANRGARPRRPISWSGGPKGPWHVGTGVLVARLLPAPLCSSLPRGLPWCCRVSTSPVGVSAGVGIKTSRPHALR